MKNSWISTAGGMLIILVAALILGGPVQPESHLFLLGPTNNTNNLMKYVFGILWIIISVLSLFLMILYPVKKEVGKKYPQLSIIGILGDRKSRELIESAAIILFSLIAYSLLSYYLNIRLSFILIIVGILGIILLSVNNIIFNFRIRYGVYGNNEREAREIIQFILKEAENIDFTENGGLKKILSNTDLVEFEKTVKASWGSKST